GCGGRDPLFLAENFIPFIQKHIKPLLSGKDITTFREMAAEIEQLEIEGVRLHTAIRYGISQALLDAVAKSKHKMMCEVISEEYGTKLTKQLIPIFTQSGDSRYENSDKMIIKGAQVLPHGLINHVKTKLGQSGELLEEYITWLRNRIIALRSDESYSPVLHLDVYGTIGMAFGGDIFAMADYLARLEKAAHPFLLRIEGPMDVDDRELQMKALRELTALVDGRGIKVEIVADEWCNTLEDIKYFTDNKAGHMVQIKTPDLGGIGNIVEAVIYCKERGIGAYQGGTCNETDRSAQVCVHLAMATGPDQILAKPGMGVDEGYMIVYNEMQRILAISKAKGLI
ncbi:MAG: methylaspartate ammonia-lyase, partial [Oscillospiraceae bacterium]|nr:methylaspartate ammonia-lyase [Oscillospiraceae bacterium]